MADLVFRIKADYEAAIRCREELDRLNQARKNLDRTTEEGRKEEEKVNAEYEKTQKRLDELCTSAAKAGYYMSNEFKEKVAQAKNEVVSLSQEVLQANKNLEFMRKNRKLFSEQDFADAEERLNDLSGSLLKAEEGYKNLTGEVGGTTKGMRSLTGVTQSYNLVMRMLPAPLRSIVGSFRTLTTATLKFIKSPLGIVVMALSAAFKGLSYWLKETASGQLLARKWMLKLSENTDMLSKKLSGAAKKLRALKEETTNNAASQMTAYRNLQRQWDKANGSLEKQKKILESKEWEKLGMSVNDVNTAEKVLISQSQNVVKSLMARARAAALYKQIEKEVADQIKAEDAVEEKNSKIRADKENTKNKAKEFEDKVSLFEQAKKDYVPALGYSRNNKGEDYFLNKEGVKVVRKQYESDEEWRQRISRNEEMLAFTHGKRNKFLGLPIGKAVSGAEAYDVMSESLRNSAQTMREAVGEMDEKIEENNAIVESGQTKIAGMLDQYNQLTETETLILQSLGVTQDDDRDRWIQDRLAALDKYKEHVKSGIEKVESEISAYQLSTFQKNAQERIEYLNHQIEVESIEMENMEGEEFEAQTKLLNSLIDERRRLIIASVDDTFVQLDAAMAEEMSMIDELEREIKENPLLNIGEKEEFLKGTAQTRTRIAEKYGLMRQDHIKDLVREVNSAGRKRVQAEMSEADEESMADEAELNEYYARYGDYEQKRLQIHLKYLGKIEAADEEHREIYIKMFSQELADLKKEYSLAEDILTNHDLSLAFGEVDKYTRVQIEKAKAALEEYKSSDKYLNASAEDVARVREAETRLNQAERRYGTRRGENSIEGLIEDRESFIIHSKQRKSLEEDQVRYAEQRKKIEAEIADLEKKGDDGDITRLTELRQELEDVDKKAKLTDKSLQDIWDALAADEEETRLDAIATVAGIATDALSDLATHLKEIAEITNDDSLAAGAEALGSIANIAGQISIGNYGAAAVSIINEIWGAITKHAAETEVARKNAEDYAHALQMLGLVVKQADFQNIFGQDTSGLLGEYGKSMRKAVGEYRAEMDKLAQENFGGDKNKDWWNGLGVALFGLGPGAAGYAAIQSNVSSQFQAYQDAIAKGYKGLETMMIKTEETTGLAKFFGAQDKFTALGELAPGIIGEDGLLDVDRAKAFLDTNSQITDEQRKQIENAIELKEAYDDAENSVKSMLSSIMGNTASDLADATIQGLTTGAELGSDQMKRILGGTAKSLQKQLVESIYASYMQKYSDEMLDKIKAGGNEEDILNLYAEMINKMSGTVAIATNAAKRFEEIAEARGFNMSQLANADVGPQTYSQISETTGSAIEGRLASIQISQGVRDQQMGILTGNFAQLIAQSGMSLGFAEEIRDTQAEALIALQAIRDNTRNNVTVVKEVRDLVDEIKKKL